MPKPRHAKRSAAPVVVHERPPRRWLPPLLILVAGIAVYANALRGPFLLDDHRTIDENESIRRLDDLGGVLHPPAQMPVTGRPLPNLTLALNYAAGGLKVEGYHAVNIGLHILAALAVFGVVRRTFARSPDPVGRAFMARQANHKGSPHGLSGEGPALIAALIWLVHPLNSETVNYVTQRTESLMALFYLLTMYAAIRALDHSGGHGGPPRRGGVKWIAVAVICAFCSVASKETALTLPFVVILWDRVFAFSTIREAWTRRWPVYALIAASWVLFLFFARELPFFTERGFETSVSRWTYLLNQAPMLAQYLKLTIWPWPLVFDYGAPQPVTIAAVWPSLILAIALLAATVIAVIRWPAVGFWGAWFFITLAPPSSVIPIPTEVGAERRMYLPLIGVIALVATGVDSALSRNLFPWREPLWFARGAVKARPAIAAVVILVLGALTIRRNVDYQNGLAIWQTSLDRRPQPRAHEHLSMFLRDAGRIEDAIVHIRAAAPESPNARHALASALLERGDVAGAIEHFRIFVRDHADNKDIVSARQEFAVALMHAGDTAGAIEQLRAVTATLPDYAGGHMALAQLLEQTRDTRGAAAEYRRALQLQPENVIALAGLGALVASTDPAEAMTVLRKALSLEPRALPPRKQLAQLLLAAGRIDEMLTETRTLVARAPGDPESHNLLGVALASSGQFAAANEQFEEVLRLDPSNIDARANLGRLRALAQRVPARE